MEHGHIEFEERKKISTSLDIAPLIDIVFLLIIFFMLTANFVMHPGIKINLPSAVSAKAEKNETAGKRKDAAQVREKQAPKRKRVTDIEAELRKLRSEIKRLDEALAHPDLFVKDPAKGAQIAKAKVQREKAIDALEEEWLTLSEGIELEV